MKIREKLFLSIALCKFGHKQLAVSKTITARSFKLGQLIEERVKLPGENYKIICFLVIALCIFLVIALSKFGYPKKLLQLLASVLVS